jgi:hypothetical protein
MPGRAQVSLPNLSLHIAVPVLSCTHGISTSLYVIQRDNNRQACFCATSTISFL